MSNKHLWQRTLRQRNLHYGKPMREEQVKVLVLMGGMSTEREVSLSTGEAVARGLAEGAKPGASTSLRLPVGDYEVRYWACADVGKTATVGLSFAGKDLRDESVLDQWKQFTATVTVEKANVNSSLALTVSTHGVRVWFDDVEFVRK